MNGFQLLATGGALPGRTVTNDDLSRMVDTSDDWITSRTGIRTRHWCTEGESAATLAIAAAKQALARSGLAPADIACCICATLSAPDATPSVACQVQAALGLPETCPALDINAACSGFLYGTAVARGLLATLGGQYALVIGCEALSRLMDPADRSTCVLFGDGAGAAIFELAADPTPFAVMLGARGDAAIHAGGPSRAGSAPITMDGRAVFRFAVDALPKCLHAVLDETLKQLDLLCRDGVAEKEFREAKNQLRGSYLLGLESPGSRMQSMGRGQLHLDRCMTPEETVAKIEAVTIESVNAVARRIFSNAPCISVVGKQAETYIKE